VDLEEIDYGRVQQAEVVEQPATRRRTQSPENRKLNFSKKSYQRGSKKKEREGGNREPSR
jgi:hypothetical protein